MYLVEIIGALAAITSTISLIPQISKVHATKSTADLSYLMLFNFLITSLLWVFYGALITSYSVLVCNVLMTLSAGWLLMLKHRHG